MTQLLTDEQVMLKDMARGFLGEHSPVSALRRLRDTKESEGFDRSVWSAMAELGWAGVLVPEAHGGVDMGMVAAGVIAEEMGRTLAASPFVATAMVGAAALSAAGTADQQTAWLPGIAAGELTTTLAVDEMRRHAPEHIAMPAKRSGNGFVLEGTKAFVADGHTADVIIVAARTGGTAGDRDGITLFLLPAGTDGLYKERLDMVDSRNAARLEFNGVEVTADAVLGEVDAGFEMLEQALDVGRAGLSAEAIGAAQAAFDQTMDYLRTRKQFGVPIGSFQSLRHRAAALYCDIELARSAVLKALKDLETAPGTAGLAVAAAKAKVSEVAQRVAQEAIQMHGGIGMTDEYDIGFYIKRIRVAAAMFGDVNFHTDRFARLSGY